MTGAAAIAAGEISPEARSPGQLVWRRFRRNKRALVCAGVLVLVVAGTYLIPFLAPDRHIVQNDDEPYGAPSSAHPFGQDQLGRDLLFRTLYGGKVSLAVGFLATLVSAVIGVLYGSSSALAGGKVDGFMMRVVDVLYGLPYMFVVIIVMAIFESRSLLLVFAVLGLFQWPTMARIVRGQVLSLKERSFVEAARAMGTSTPAILFRHILPNTVGPIIVFATLSVPSIMLQEAFLGFLGLSVTEPGTSWGTLLSEGRVVVGMVMSGSTPWWLVLFPGILLAVTLFCLNAVGDGLRDAFDVEARE